MVQGRTKPDRSLVVAGSQFPVTASVADNQAWIARHLEQAAGEGADLLLTCEAALSGYAGADFHSWAQFDWARLREATAALAGQAGTLGIQLVLGSAHWLGEGLKPTNCLYLFGPGGELVDRYDKCQLTDTDKAFYTSGRHKVVHTLGGMKVGFLVCYDVCYPEMYAWYRAEDVELMLHAFYNAGFPPSEEAEPPYTILDEVKPAWLRARAADNQMWIVATNSSREHCCWGTRVVRPDGSVAAELERGEPGLLIHRFPDDSRKGWEHNFRPLQLATNTEYGQGEISGHPRYVDRQSPP